MDDGATARYRYNAGGQRVYKRALLEEGADPDLNGDGEVTEADLHVLQKHIRQGEAPISADLNGDGKVNGRDTPCIATRMGADKNQGRGKGRDRKADKAHAPDHNKGRHGCLRVPEPETRLFAYDEWRLLGAYEANGAAVQETVWLGNLPIATVRDGKVYHVHTDHLGAPRVVTDPATGTAVWRWSSDPFGRAEANEDPDGNGEEFTYNLRFPGQYYDAETGKHYNYFRDYEPDLGRYIQSDPLGIKGGMNVFEYAQGNPIKRIDPEGLFMTSVDRYHLQVCMRQPTEKKRCECHCQTATEYSGCVDTCMDCFSSKKISEEDICNCICKSTGQFDAACDSLCSKAYK